MVLDDLKIRLEDKLAEQGTPVDEDNLKDICIAAGLLALFAAGLLVNVWQLSAISLFGCVVIQGMRKR